MRRVVLMLALTLVASVVGAVPAGAAQQIPTVVTFQSPIRVIAYPGYSWPPLPVVGWSLGFRARLMAEGRPHAHHPAPGLPLAGRTISFWAADVVGRPRLLCTATTRADGVATCEHLVTAGILGPCPCGIPWLPRRADKVYAEFRGDRTHQSSSAEASWVTVG